MTDSPKISVPSQTRDATDCGVGVTPQGDYPSLHAHPTTPWTCDVCGSTTDVAPTWTHDPATMVDSEVQLCAEHYRSGAA